MREQVVKLGSDDENLGRCVLIHHVFGNLRYQCLPVWGWDWGRICHFLTARMSVPRINSGLDWGRTSGREPLRTSARLVASYVRSPQRFSYATP